MKELSHEEFKSKLKGVLLTKENIILTDLGDKFNIELGNDTKVVMYLNNAYIRYKQGTSMEEIIDSFVKPILNNKLFNHNLENWEVVKSKIYPMLKNADFVTSQVNSLIYKSDIIPLIVICYVIDIDDQVIFITDKIAEKLGVNVDTIHQCAIVNLKKLPTKVQNANANGEVFYACQSLDSYDASRILTIDFNKYQEKMKSKLLVAIPNRDFLIIFNEKTHFLPNFIKSIMKDFMTRPYPIIPVIYQWDGKKLSPTIYNYLIK